MRFTLERRIADAQPAGSGVRIRLDDGSARYVDHVVLGTGFRIDAGSCPFLSERLASDLHLVDGYPRLGPGLQSNVPGLHFTGAPASFTFGPIIEVAVIFIGLYVLARCVEKGLSVVGKMMGW